MWQRPRFPFQQGGGDPDLKDKISMDLGLSEVQKEKYYASAMSHQMEMAKLEQKQRRLVKEYFDFLKLPVVDEGDKKNKLDEIAATEARKVQTTFNHFEELKNLGDPDQQKKFGDIVEEIQQVLFSDGKKMPPPRRD
ncbi:hypothetical protein ADICYQ_1421 [Cyclobacterium qasimii M12-11B]|uniref:Uncharacterized protein n=1 Tax=Cyclobacterium qasimii M12-11B TaxID=641524 RepID=S7VI32_9BACT|nr:hypothetical protein ADICYQ_1421 [Cyclobacterium qasimii M12-11B]